MPMSSHVGDPVHLILDGGKPARFCWKERWRVTQATADAFDWLGDDSRVVGWRVAAQTEDQSDSAEFELARDFAAGGWTIDTVTYA